MTARKESYLEKLRDPRWQKKRLEILDRDGWACQRCGETTKTLHVHHRLYHEGYDPWDYDQHELLTLCEDCHEYETLHCAQQGRDLINSLKQRGLLSDDLASIACNIEMGEPWSFHSDIVVDLLAVLFCDPTAMAVASAAVSEYRRNPLAQSKQSASKELAGTRSELAL